MGHILKMDLRMKIQSSVLILFLILTTSIQSTQTKLHGRRHKRQHGAHLYLPESYIIPNGEGRANEWGPWGSPSECSRTCGGGVAYQTRECLNIGPDGQARCSGGNRKYFSCNSQDCPETELDFRSQQCAHFDSVPFEGLRYDWVPYTKAPNPCELNCMPRGERFYYRHKTKVIDGTRCSDESLDVCVEGVCQPVGCDMMLGSSAREDKCRKCAGDGSSCKTVSGLLDMNNLQVGYNDILLIPSGATNIDIKEISPSNNYLAIRNLSAHYYLNGNWRIDFPRPLTFAGAIWTYDRRPQGFAAPDHITCIGPTNEPVYLVLLYQDRNVGINYEYSVPEGSAHLTEPDTYSWTFTPFSACSNTCGGGFQTRTVTCNSRTTLEQVDHGLCDQSTKPSDSQQCGQESCPPRWAEGPYTKCSAACGNNGTQTREVHCEHVSSTGVATTIDDSVCLDQVGNKPASVSPCNVGVVCPEWHIGPWQPCDKLCGAGTQTRKLKCFKKIDGKIEVLKNDDCPGEKPESNKECMLRPCEGVDWITSSWSGCKTCGLTQETRTAFCASKSGTVYNDSFCTNHPKPPLSQPCEAPICEYQWFKSQWSKCSAECGKGVQTRNVVCGKFDGGTIQKDEDESKCSADDKPEDTRECEVETECPGQWFSGPWSECSKTCGGGIRNRKVLCLADGKAVPETKCSKDNIEFSTDDCNIIACVDDETIPVDATSKPIVEDDEGEDYCDEDEEFTTSDGVLKIIPVDGISAGIDIDGLVSTESSLITDDLMLSDSTGFETDLTDGLTDISFSSFDGSGESTTDEAFASSDGSGDDELSTDSVGTSASLETRSQQLTTDDIESSSTSKSIEDTSTSETEAMGSSSGSTDTSDVTSESTSKGIEVSSSSYDASETTDSLASHSASETTTTSSLSSDLTTGTDIQKTSESVSDSASESVSVTSSLSESTSESAAQSTSESVSHTATESTSESSSQSTSESISESASTPSSESTSELSTESTSELTSDSSSPSSASQGASESTTTDMESSSDETITGSSTLSIGLTSEGASEATTGTAETLGSSPEEATTLAQDTQSTVSSLASETDVDVSTSTDISGGTTTSEIDSSSTPSTSEISEQGESVTDSSTISDTGATEATDISQTASSSSDEIGTTDSSSEKSTEQTDVSSVSSSEATADLTESTDSSTIESSTDEDIEASTIDIWSTTSGSKITDDVDEISSLWGSSTPHTLESIVTKEQTPRKCKPRPKIAACLKAAFGCCADNSTAATGPFDEGCPTPETCKETKFGCCLDGLSPAKGPKNKGCPKPLCTASLFGCCLSDGITEAEGENNEGCPIITTTIAPTTVGDCTSSKFGCCSDGVSEAAGPNNEGCEECTGDECTTETSGLTELTEEIEGTEEAVTEKDCSRSTYGCCPDGLSEATGERFHGCSIIDEKDCTKSYFGCCPDNRTAARGPNDEGCSPCLQEPFGCCPDGITPAHGRTYEGCCLETPYGCCPDNINPAQGPQLEGCGCEYSPYGCCPDNKTSARGRDNEGCGCKFSPFGCCPDKQTPAQGEKYAGCPCHTFQFGCCPDGITIPQGPHNYGCHCSQSEFKCCSDGVTPAKGPNNEGCTCEHSRYGCCPDGSADAQGSNFEGCEHIPSNPQKACSLKKDLGTCMDFTVKNFYDSEYGACTRFWYSGCGGNENRFETNEDCVQTCEQPEGKAACLLPKIHGPCTGYYPSYFYDSDRNVCSQFIYGGCLGNNNRFETMEACQKLCVVDQALAPCDQPVETGPCNGTFENWYFDKESDICRPFIYGGCKGNKNRYPTEQSCNYHCKTPGSHKAKDLCLKPAEAGDCQNYTARWYYDTKEERCRQFYYGGCGGSDNNFLDEQACISRCQKTPTTIAPPPSREEQPQPSEFSADSCNLEYDAGPCRITEAKWYYNRHEGICEMFAYGGCGGNANNFQSADECESSCGNIQNPCALPPIYGRCHENSTRWHYDIRTDECVPFVYSGCRGNKNNFYTDAECRNHCQRRAPPPPEEKTRPPSIETRFDDVQLDCSAPVAEGNCNDNILLYFFNQDTVACEAFQYTGCGGNGNRFETIEQCERECIEREEIANEEDNVIDHGEYRTAKPDSCQQLREECNSLHCPYGIARTYDQNGCERCECENPCRGYLCPDNTKCAVDIQSDPDLGSAFAPICRKVNKPGNCPTLANTTRCERECYDDADCRGDNKCCYSGCGYVCVLPYEPKVTYPQEPQRPPPLPTAEQGSRPPALEKLPKNEVDVVQPEGDVATLRCYATGYPLPTVTWKRGTIIINTNQGRYVLTSTGDLQIVQVHRSDSGTYVCIADNGIGAPVQREVGLTVSVPVSTNIILPNGNTFAVGSDITIQCDVQGYPTPTVTWYKNDEEIQQSPRVQITESNRLILLDARVEDSGYYKCSARNEFSQSYHAEQINVDGVFVPVDCTDNPYFANCKLIVKAKYCTHKYYAKFCCKSCTLAGQLYFTTNLLL